MMEYSEEDLVERARIALLKSGNRTQPANDSDVQEVDGIPHAVLRNVNGIIAVYQYNGKSLKRIFDWPEALS